LPQVSKLLCLLPLLISINRLHAQTSNTGTIKGKIISTQKNAVAYALVLLKNNKDSSIYKTALSNEDGRFSFSLIKQGSYFLEMSLIGFEKIAIQDIQLNESNATVDLGFITLKDSVRVLGAVTIQSRPPFIERQLDKTVVNVDNSIVSAGITALEMMQKLPGVQMSDGGQITLEGKSGVTVFIDGKATYLSAEDLANLLRGMSSADIQKIEIMTKPSAKFDAEGSGGIINIIKKKNRKEGLNGSVNGSLVQSNYGRYNGGFTLNYKNKAFNLFFNNSYVYKKTLFDRTVTANILNADNSLNNEQVSNTSTVSTYKGYSPSIGIDLYLSKKTTITFSGNAKASSDYNPITAVLNAYDSNKIKTNTTDFSNIEKNRAFNYTASIHVDHEIDTLGKSITADVDYANYSNSPTQNITNSVYDAVGNFLSVTNTALNGTRNLYIYAAKADYTRPLKHNAKFEAGWKSSYVRSINDYTYYNKTGGQSIADSSQSDYTVTEENINAAYANLSKEYKKLTVEAGVRAEQTWSKGTQLLTGQEINQNYLQLFPSAFFDYKIDDNHGLNIKIARRTDRAAYSEMIPYRRSLSPTLYFMGNPNLKPQLSWHGEITWSYHNALFITFGYDICHDYIRTLPYLDSNEITVTRVPTNINGAYSWNTDIDYSKKLTKWWSTDNSFSIYQNSFKGQTEGFSLNNNGMPSIYISSNNSFSISNGLSAECSYEYNSKRQLVTSSFGAYSILSFGIKKLVFNGRGTITLNVNNLLQSESHNAIDKYSELYQYSYWHYYTRAASINFNYRFGKGKTAKTHTGSAADDEKSRAGN